jgi:hypothetical protein
MDGRLGGCCDGGGGTARGAVGGSGGIPCGMTGEPPIVLASRLCSLACDFRASLWVSPDAMSVS